MDLLQAPKRIGLTLTEGGMLVPEKSITALVGISDRPEEACGQKCMRCNKTDWSLPVRTGGRGRKGRCPMKPLLQAMKERRLYLDGGMGSMLQAAGLPEGLLPDVWGMENPQAVQGVHRAYLEAAAA